jgi:hypothetical protein
VLIVALGVTGTREPNGGDPTTMDPHAGVDKPLGVIDRLAATIPALAEWLGASSVLLRIRTSGSGIAIRACAVSKLRGQRYRTKCGQVEPMH